MLLEGEEMGSYYVMRKEFQSKMKRVLDMDGSDGCTTMWMDLRAMNYIL